MEIYLIVTMGVIISVIFLISLIKMFSARFTSIRKQHVTEVAQLRNRVKELERKAEQK